MQRFLQGMRDGGRMLARNPTLILIASMLLALRLGTDLTVVAANTKRAPDETPSQITRLKLHQPITVALKAGQVDKYVLPLREGQFACVKLLQQSVGVGYFVYTPDNTLIRNEDLNAIHQSEIITIDADQPGNYRIEVFWDYGRPQFGNYSIVWDKLEATGNNPATKAAQLMGAWYNADEPGAVVAVLQNGKVIFKLAKGLANLEYKAHITDTSAFELASNSKQFTGYAIAMLVAQGKISLDDDIRKYLPEMPDFGKKIALRHLVYHTSGLLNWDTTMFSTGYRADDIVTMDMVMKMVANQKQLSFNPGDAFAYCNRVVAAFRISSLDRNSRVLRRLLK